MTLKHFFDKLKLFRNYFCTCCQVVLNERGGQIKEKFNMFLKTNKIDKVLLCMSEIVNVDAFCMFIHKSFDT